MRRFGKGNGLNLVAIGDSQEADRSVIPGGAVLAQTFPLLIARDLGYANCVNLAAPGKTTSQMLSEQLPQALLHRAGAAIVCGFVNDMTTEISGGVWVGGGISSTTTKANLKSIVQALQAARHRVMLMSGIPVFQTVYLDNAAAYVTAISQIPGETGCDFIDTYTIFLNMDATLRASRMLDDQHPNPVGHAYIASLRTGSQFTQF